MQIYVVKAGDTLMEIATLFNISMSVLITSNEIENPESLVPGQTIVIPIWGSYYFVKPGDSLYSLSRRYKIPVGQLIEVNNLQPTSRLVVGQRIYIPQAPRKAVYTGGYIDTDVSGKRSTQIIEDVGKNLSTIQLFSYQVSSTGELKPPKYEDEVLTAAQKVNSRPLMVITNIEGGKFTPDVATALFKSEALQEKVLTEVIKIMREKGYKGLDVDFEYLGAENRVGYNTFMAKAKDKLKPYGYTLSTALAPKISDTQIGRLYEGHDYEFLGKVVDFIFVMTYEWGWVGGAPRAVAPLNEVRRVMEYAMSKVPKEKLMMGIPLYGYDWKLPFVEGKSRAKTISNPDAILLADKYGVNIDYDPVAASPHFNYKDETGIAHEVWFEDARSIQAKFNLVKELDNRGLFYWVLGRDFAQNWLLLEDNFVVKTY
ncbi:MAG: glycoside hydrolase family 18 protein [Vallitaleaceae bacterium]|nr:glycoside hydrolase family 18 protein [Vallitaleaceae bacterium]